MAWANQRVTRHRLWQAAVARAMALVLLLTLVPIPVSAIESERTTVGAVIENSIWSISGGSASTDAGSAGLVQHTHCVCHSIIRLSPDASTVQRVDLEALLSPDVEAQPRLAPFSLPFKPPRNA